MATLSFVGMANIAVRLVNDQYPGSQLYEGDGISPSGPTTNVNDVNSWRFVFRTANGGTAFISSTEWGEFGPVTYVNQPWLEDVVIPWPIPMDIVEADQLLKNAGYTGPYGAVTLRWPLYPFSKQPFYIFGMVDGSHIFVGIYDKNVTQNTVSVGATAEATA
jgi:hypothetical protein